MVQDGFQHTLWHPTVLVAERQLVRHDQRPSRVNHLLRPALFHGLLEQLSRHRGVLAEYLDALLYIRGDVSRRLSIRQEYGAKLGVIDFDLGVRNVINVR